MSKYIFIKEPVKNEHPQVKVSLEVSAITLTELIESFEQFCLACGFAQESIDKYFGEERE